MRTFDAIVVGAGAMGSSSAQHLAERGSKTLVLEKFDLNHQHGSSHGKSRIIRTAYAEDPRYVPLVKRAFSLWRGLEKKSGNKLLTMTGGLMIGSPDSWLVKGVLASAREHALLHRVMGRREVAEEFPVFRMSEAEVAVHEKHAGFLLAEECVRTMKEAAEGAGAEFRFKEAVLSWESGGEGVEVRTSEGTYSAQKLVIAAGSRLTKLVPGIPVQCERQAVFWFRPKGNALMFSPSKMPVFVWELHDSRIFYGVPDHGEGVKAAQTHGGRMVDPEEAPGVTPNDLRPVRVFLRRRIPRANGRVVSSTTCLYTNTPDQHFVLDSHPRAENVLVVSPCSGHGFKFASVIGEAVAEMVLDGRTREDISLFSLARFNLGTSMRP